MLTTSRRGVQYPDPARTDRADIAAHLGYLAAALDLDVLYNEGTDAARGSATHIHGRFWWTTDTGFLWYDDGTTWHNINAVLAAGTVTNAMVNAAAAIAYSKLNLAGSLVNADVASGAAIAYAKLALAASIVNADIASGAAIAYSKLNLAGSIVNADIASGAALAISKLAGYPSDATKALLGNGTWGALTKAANGGVISSSANLISTDDYPSGGSGMLGLAMAITLGASTTGKIVVHVSSTVNLMTNATQHLLLKYGTGGAPAREAAVVGTSAGGTVHPGSAVGPCSLTAYISGLSASTTYWLDVALTIDGPSPQGGNNCGLYDGSWEVHEVG